MPQKKETILVILVFYFSENELPKFFASFEGSEDDLEFFIVLNSSTQFFDTISVPFKITFHSPQKNMGFGAAVNKGLEYSINHNFNYVVLLNPDIHFSNKTIFRELIKTSKRYNNAILAPRQKNACDELDPLFEAYILDSTPLGEKLFSAKFVNAAFWLIPLTVIKNIGGFNPLFFMYGEDLDYCIRAKKAGIDILIDTNLEFYHNRISKITQQEKIIYKQNSLLWIKTIHSSDIFLIRINSLLSNFAKIIWREKRNIHPIILGVFLVKNTAPKIRQLLFFKFPMKEFAFLPLKNQV